MMKFKYLTLTILLCIYGVQLFSQPNVGEWTDYQSYAHAKNVVDTGDKIYCVTEGGLFSYNKTDNSIRKMSGISGLSDTGVERTAYSKENDLLLIAYQNANIDLMFGNEIFNLSDIKRKQIAGNKTINNVMFSGNLAYLSCGFGIVVINLERKEIKDTYFIGNEGEYINVLDLATDGTFLYAATSEGIYKANASEPNLQNYNNWMKQTNIPHANDKFSEVEFFGGKIIANYTPDEIFQLNGSDWNSFLPEMDSISDITQNENFIVFSSLKEVSVYNNNYELVQRIKSYTLSGKEVNPTNISCAVLDDQNILWIADLDNGLIKVGTQDEQIIPAGPVDNQIFSLSMNGSDLWISSGGRDNAWDNLRLQPKFQLARNGNWSVFDSNLFPAGNGFKDIVCVTADPNDPDHVFAGSWGGGILEFKAGKFVKRHDNFNSSLQTQWTLDPSQPYVRIGGMAFDPKGNMWVSNSGVSKVISVLKTDGTWEAYSTPEIANISSVGKIVVTQDEDKWVLIPRNKGYGIFILNKTNDETVDFKVTSIFKNSEGEFLNEMSDVYAMVEDLNGEIWVGTSGGVAVYSNPQRVWTESPFYATRPGLNLHDGLFHPLLEKEVITCIAVDGANRKWIGTRTSGVFLISEDGDEELEHFNTENSALPGNEISDIAINQQTGEVFIGTSAGLISYMGEATTGKDVFDDVYVSPNPVRETYDGPIVVRGLLEDTDVKITTISGNLVYKTTSLGGQAIWDGKNLNGNRCKTGVYLVFLTDPLGEQTKVTKLLFIH